MNVSLFHIKPRNAYGKPLLRRCTFFLLLLVSAMLPLRQAGAQELYPLSEAASNMPKGVLGIRAMAQYYTQRGAFRNMDGLRVMYGLSSRITIQATSTVANHHPDELPAEYPILHNHNTRVNYPYRLNGVHLYGKYRFLSQDGQNRHFRMALYAEAAYNNIPHDEAEPDLMEDNSGWGTGLISTYLYRKFAVSASIGLVKPANFSGKISDPIPGLPFIPARIHYPYGSAFSLSFGYLLFPRQYSSYRQTNWNLYLELKGKYYGAPEVYLANPVFSMDEPLDYRKVYTKSNPLLDEGYYVNMHYGVQCILRSNLRIEGTIGFPMIHRSLIPDYPVINIGIQRFFY